ncbi:MAG: hypothetical protein EXR75_00910 [Myxococcales bacterium]|nr:hypothetical protein [Myxococcales bacterium]
MKLRPLGTRPRGTRAACTESGVWRGRLLAVSMALVAAACGSDFVSGTGGGTGAGTGSGGTGGGAASCDPGATAACYGGPAGTKGVGMCTGGERTCSDAGTWGMCDGEVVPVDESCATAGDDDCNGKVNEGGADCDCVPGVSEACYSGAAATQDVGPCVGGTRLCSDAGKWGACEGEVVPGTEDCDALLVDEDCDGQTNEGGAACVCALGSLEGCYTGPAPTLGVGNCKGGSHTCNTDGTAWLACTGEVVPATEDCYVKGDEDCEGNPCSDAIFNFTAGGANASAYVIDTAFDSAGNVIAVGSFLGTVAIGGQTKVALGNDGFIVKLDKSGAVLWSAYATGAGYQAFTAVAVGPGDEVFAAGSYDGVSTFGGTALTLGSNAVRGAFVGKLDSAGVSKAVQFDWNGSGTIEFTDIAVSATQVATVGSQTGNYVVDGFNYSCFDKAVYAQYWTTALVPTGSYAPEFIDDTGDQRITSAAYDGNGNLFVAGLFDTNITFGTTKTTTTKNDDAFVAKLNSAKGQVWIKAFATTAKDVVLGLDTNANVGVGVSFTTSIKPGSLSIPSAGSDDVMLAVYGSTGTLKYGKVFGDVASQRVSSVAFDSKSQLVADGAFGGTLDFGGKPMVSGIAGAMYLVKLDWAVSTVSWSKSIYTGAALYPYGLAVGSGDRIALGALYVGTLDLGLGPKTSFGGGGFYFDALVAVFNP